MQMAQIGGTAKGGCDRQALTDLDVEGRSLFATWCRELDLNISHDAIGNMFARLPGKNPALPPLVIGSHLDTQPTGGKYDGVLGVLAGLEVLQTIGEKAITPDRSLEVAVWMNEEGARFAPAMMGSGVFAGMLDLAEIRSVTDSAGISVGEALDRHGYSSGSDPTAKDMHAYLELHIEQGPVLEAQEKSVGVVTGAQGIRWYDVTLAGQEAHAGPTPMSLRRDPMELVPDLVREILEIGKIDPDARATIGQFQAHPGSRNVIPGSISLTVDLRHPNEETLSNMHDRLTGHVQGLSEICAGTSAELRQIWHSPVVEFDDDLIRSIRMGAELLGYSHLDMISGAGHDSLMVARCVPTAMIFIPCLDGISHNEAEHIEPEQAEAGANVLLCATLETLGIAIQA